MERNKIIAVVGLLAIGIFAVLQKDPLRTEDPTPTPAGTPTPLPPDLLKKLIVKDVKVGTGPAAAYGDMLKVDYTGKLTDGQVFDSSKGKTPFDLTLGAGQVIKGWDLGLKGMKKGGKRTITIPPELAYGDAAQAKIPANSTLVFDVELIDITKPGGKPK